MATKWTSARDQNLLLLLFQDTPKMDYDKLAERWAKVYTTEDYKPTGNAIKEHVKLLKRKKKGENMEFTQKSSAPKVTPSSTPKSTPKKRAATELKTPSSAAKKSRYSYSKTTSLSDEDEGDDDTETEDLPDLQKKRITPIRASRTPRKNYGSFIDDNGSEDDIVGAIKETDAKIRTVLNIDSDTADEEYKASHRDRVYKARSKRDPPKLNGFYDLDADSSDGYKPDIV